MSSQCVLSLGTGAGFLPHTCIPVHQIADKHYAFWHRSTELETFGLYFSEGLPSKTYTNLGQTFITDQL